MIIITAEEAKAMTVDTDRLWDKLTGIINKKIKIAALQGERYIIDEVPVFLYERIASYLLSLGYFYQWIDLKPSESKTYNCNCWKIRISWKE